LLVPLPTKAERRGKGWETGKRLTPSPPLLVSDPLEVAKPSKKKKRKNKSMVSVLCLVFWRMRRK
jgi:hypothetical protein